MDFTVSGPPGPRKSAWRGRIVTAPRSHDGRRHRVYHHDPPPSQSIAPPGPDLSHRAVSRGVRSTRPRMGTPPIPRRAVIGCVARPTTTPRIEHVALAQRRIRRTVVIDIGHCRGSAAVEDRVATRRARRMSRRIFERVPAFTRPPRWISVDRRIQPARDVRCRTSAAHARGADASPLRASALPSPFGSPPRPRPPPPSGARAPRSCARDDSHGRPR